MNINHVGIVNNSEDEAVRFYRDFLGFEKTKESLLTAALTEQLFSVSREVKLLAFEKNGMKFEVFICPDCIQPSPDFRHVGLLIDDMPGFINNTEQAGVEHISVQKEDKTVDFIKDFSGNLIEIKQR